MFDRMIRNVKKRNWIKNEIYTIHVTKNEEAIKYGCNQSKHKLHTNFTTVFVNNVFCVTDFYITCLPFSCIMQL